MPNKAFNTDAEYVARQFFREVTNFRIPYTIGRNTITTSSKSLVGPGRFQWNAGGWFGSSLGGSAWMIVTSCFLVFHNQPTLALVPAGGFAIVLFASLLLWTRRCRIYPFPALMALLGLLAIAIACVSIVVASYGSPAALVAMNWPVSIWPTVLVCAIAPGLMIWFLFLERSVTASQQIRWDYKVIYINKLVGEAEDHDGIVSGFENGLKKLGDDGWELCLEVNGGVVLKRPR